MVAHAKTLLFLLLCIGLFAGCTSTAERRSTERSDHSLAGLLYQSEQSFVTRQASGDPRGMAEAAKDRLRIIQQIDQASLATANVQTRRQQSMRRQSLLASVQDMRETAEETAKDDPAALAYIARLFPADTIAQSGDFSNLKGMIGNRREVKMTIGLEVDATIAPDATETLRLPVAGTKGTTIYVQPTGHPQIENRVDLSMRVTRNPVEAGGIRDMCTSRAQHGRLPCYVPPGEHTEIEITLENHDTKQVHVLIFVSGNAESVAAALVNK